MLILSKNSHTAEGLVLMARDMLISGNVIAYPTETFYGIGARYDSEDALNRIYLLKDRPHDKAMPLIIGRRELLHSVAAEITPLSEKLMDAFWPGPLTLIFRARSDLSGMITADTGRVAIRIPGPSFALELARLLDFPITATSANISGMPPASDTETVIGYFDGALDAVMDLGKTEGGLPSTIVDMTGPAAVIAREGVIRKEEILSALAQ